jgi:hypothetical protein
LDVDFLVSKGVNNPKDYPALLKAVRRQEAVVLPAFEPSDNFTLQEGQEVALNALKGDVCLSCKTRPSPLACEHARAHNWTKEPENMLM